MDFHEPLVELAASVTAAGVEATTDPGVVQVPGALVQFAGVALDVLAGYTVDARVVLVGPDVDWPDAAKILGDLLTKALQADLVAPSGQIEPVTLSLPSAPAPLPALSVPVLLSVT